jgi:hypothetical protein
MRYKWSCDRTTVGWVPHCNGPRGCRCGVQGQGCDSPSREGLGSKLPLQVGLLWFAAEARDSSVLRSVQTASGAHRPFYSMRPDALSPGYGGRGVKLTTHIQLLPRSGMETYLLSPMYLRVMHRDNILCQFGPNNLISIYHPDKHNTRTLYVQLFTFLQHVVFVWIIKRYWLTRITGWCHLKIWNNLNFWLPLHADRKIGFCFRKKAVTLCVGWYVCCGMLIGVHQSDSNPVLQQRGSIINLHPSKILMTSAQVTAANVREHVARCVSQLPDSKLWPAENFIFVRWRMWSRWSNILPPSI